MVRFLERNGYDVSYIAGVDTDRRGALIKNHKVFLSVGHDEYWSRRAARQRRGRPRRRRQPAVPQRQRGRTGRPATSRPPTARHTAYRTLVTYKETWANAKIDPSTEWTGTWRDPRFAPAAPTAAACPRTR